MFPIRILIADDHVSTRTAVRTILELEKDFQIIGEADNGLAVLTAVRNLAPNIVLMDHHMPLADGMETTRQLKACWPHVGVIFLAGEENGRQEAYRAGAEAYLLKDTPPDVLVATIRTVAHRQYLSSIAESSPLSASAVPATAI